VKFNLMRQETKNKNETKVDDTQGVDEIQLRGHKIRDIFHSSGQSTGKGAGERNSTKAPQEQTNNARN
ncbi:826_t:CDS:1, partial [Ambispora gerdemannii]